MTPNLLTIAGSDPSGGAGIQADLKTFSALGAYGMSVLTGLTAQNTRGVRSVHAVPAAFVREQLDSVFDDVRVDAVKIGMLATADVIDVVASVLRERRPPYVVLDPVMVATSGDRLLAADAVARLRDVLLPHVDLITPNLPEAADLLGVAEAHNEVEMRDQLDALCKLAPGVLLKGGHLGGAESPDLFAMASRQSAARPQCDIAAQPHDDIAAQPQDDIAAQPQGEIDGAEPTRLVARRIETTSDHGTGCTLSSAIAALRPQRDSWLAAVIDAKSYLTLALAAAERLEVGGGHGPVHHFHSWW